MLNYNLSLANYPTKYKGYVVSPLKICIQFEDVEIKARAEFNDLMLIKYGVDNEKHSLVSTLGTKYNCIAVGCKIPIIEEMQFDLLNAYKTYNDNYAETYKKAYNKEFKEFLKVVYYRLGDIISGVGK